MTVMSLKKRTIDELKDLGQLWDKLTLSQQKWFDLYRRAVLHRIKPDLKLIAPDQDTFDKIWPEVVYEGHAQQRQTESKATRRHTEYRLTDYVEQIGAGEREIIDYIDKCNAHAGTTVYYSRGKHGSDNFDELLEYEFKRMYLHTPAAKRHHKRIKANNEREATEYYQYIDQLKERNAQIIARGEALWQKPVEELEALIKQQQEEIENEVLQPVELCAP